MRPITGELIQECFYPGTFARERDKWKVITEHGRVFVFDENRFDLSQCLTPLVPGETEESREEMLYGACYFSHLVWGCVDVRSLGLIWRWKIADYATGYKFTVDDNSFRRFGISEVKAVFGETATVSNNWLPLGWKITVPDVGHVVIGVSGEDLNVKSHEGNLYGETLRFLKRTQGRAVVTGKTQFCATFVAHGEAMGIRVIPEIPVGFFGLYLRSHLAVIPVAGLGFVLSNMFPNLNLWWLIAGGWILAAILMHLLMGDGRKRGDALINKFQPLGGRTAVIDDIRDRGML